MDINVQLFDKICRVCLSQSTELKSLFTKSDGEERNLLELLTFTANVDIKIEDNLPKHICVTCESSMCKAHAFKRRCLESEIILKDINRNVGDEEKSSKEKCLIKDEKSDDIKQKLSEYGTFVSSVPSNSVYKYDFDKKNIALQDFPICPTTCEFTINTQPVKEETVEKFDDGNDFIDFDDSAQIEISIETRGKGSSGVKTENNKIELRYQCYCETIFTSKDKYKLHLKENKCNSFKFIKLGRDKRLLKTQLHCQKCDVKLHTLYAYKAHQCKYHSDDTELYQCSYCLRKFKHKTSLEAHIQKHEETFNVKYPCEICKREFKYKAYLDNHLLTAHSRTSGFTCDVCVQSFVCKETLEAHKKSHDNERKHRCTECNKAFSMLCTLKEHMRTHTGEKPFLCSQCGKGFSQKNNLGQHMRRHQGLKPFKCDSCEKRFVSKGELDAHTRKHSGAHPFMCDDCGNGFTTSSALVKHRRTHTGERPYQCDLCPMRFAASGTLKNHRRTHTGERPFQCSYCEKAFVQRNDLISHIRCHTGERPYICTQCGQSFRKSSGLKAHIKMHIKEPVVGVNAMLTSMHCSES